MKGTSQQRLHSGVEEVLHPQTPFILLEKLPKRHNVLVGNDPAQVRFMESFTGLTVQVVLTVGDESIFGKEEPQLFQVDGTRNIQLSPAIKTHVNIWSLSPVVKDTPGARALIKHAMGLLKLTKLPKGQLERASDMLIEAFPADQGEQGVRDIRAAICAAMWILSGDISEEKPPRWKQPWESPYGWLPRNVDPSFRLNALYREAVAWVYAYENDNESLRKFGISPSRQQRLSRQKLDIDKMVATILTLSTWKMEKSHPLVVALKLSRIWER